MRCSARATCRGSGAPDPQQQRAGAARRRQLEAAIATALGGDGAGPGRTARDSRRHSPPPCVPVAQGLGLAWRGWAGGRRPAGTPPRPARGMRGPWRSSVTLACGRGSPTVGPPGGPRPRRRGDSARGRAGDTRQPCRCHEEALAASAARRRRDGSPAAGAAEPGRLRRERQPERALALLGPRKPSTRRGAPGRPAGRPAELQDPLVGRRAAVARAPSPAPGPRGRPCPGAGRRLRPGGPRTPRTAPGYPAGRRNPSRRASSSLSISCSPTSASRSRTGRTTGRRGRRQPGAASHASHRRRALAPAPGGRAVAAPPQVVQGGVGGGAAEGSVRHGPRIGAARDRTREPVRPLAGLLAPGEGGAAVHGQADRRGGRRSRSRLSSASSGAHPRCSIPSVVIVRRPGGLFCGGPAAPDDLAIVRRGPRRRAVAEHAGMVFSHGPSAVTGPPPRRPR